MADKGVKEIVDLRAELEDRDSQRNASYDEVLQFYGGSDYRTTKRQGHIGGIMQALSSIFQPKEADEDSELRTPINLVKPAIENKVSFLSLPFTVKVIEPPDTLAPGATQQPAAANPGQPLGAPSLSPPSGAPAPGAGPPGQPTGTAPGSQFTPDWGMDLADREEKVIRSLLDFSNIPKRSRDVAWAMSAMDGAVIGVWPDFKHERPRVFTRTPQDFFPVSYDPDGRELSKALWVDKDMTGQEIFARWGNKDYLKRDDVEVIQYIDEEKFCTVLDNKEWAHPPVDNMMGIVPIVCVGNLGLPGMIFGSTDVKDAIPVAREINYQMALIDEISAASVRPVIAIRDPLNVPDEIALGRGGVITMGGQGKVDVLGPISLPNAFWQLNATLQNWFDLISDNPAVLRSEGGGSIVTGKGFNAQLGPIAARMQARLDILMSSWSQLIRYMMLMWANFPGVGGKIRATGTKGKEAYFIEATPDEFMVNGEMWTEIRCFLDASSFIDRQGSVVEIMQLYQNELIDWQTAVDNISYVTDRKATRRNIDKDREWKAQGMAMATQAAQSPMTANTDIGAQQRTNYGLERGFMGETGPPPGPEAQGAQELPTAAQALPAPTDQFGPMKTPPGMEGEDELVSLLREFFSSIGKLRGAVWFGGDPINAPEKFESDNWTVTVWVTDPADKGTITRAAEKVPEVYGHIEFIDGAPGAGETAIQVAGGEQAPEEQSGPPGASPSALPPELMAMMGGQV